MQLATSFRRLGRNDVRLIGRDLFLIYLFVYINVMALALRFGLPYLDATFAPAAACRSDCRTGIPCWWPTCPSFSGRS